MKTTTPLFLFIVCLFLAGCSEDDQVGSHLHKIKYYDFIYTGSGYYAEKKFYYDEQGRINRTIATNNLGHYFLTDYTYTDNAITVREFAESSESVEKALSLKFEEGHLVEFVIVHELPDKTETATVNFSYESARLNAIQFEGDTYEVEVDQSGNIVHLQNDEFNIDPEYDNHANPLQGVPIIFVMLSYHEGLDNRLFLRNFIQYFSPNNLLNDQLDYKYQDGKVTEMKETINGTWTKAEFIYRDL